MRSKPQNGRCASPPNLSAHCSSPSSAHLFRIASIKPPSLTDGEDQIYWGCSKLGIFTVKSAFSFLDGQRWDSEDKKWDSIWKWKGLERIKLFLWLAMHDKLLTNAERVRRRGSLERTS